MLRIIIFIAIAASVLYYLYGNNGKITADQWSVSTGSIRERIQTSPVQQDLSKPRTVPFGDGHLTLLAKYDITARLLSKKSYWFDKESNIAPLDLALGWGAMANFDNISQLSFRQSGRFYYYEWSSDGPPLDSNVIGATSANVHIIPANDTVRKTIDTATPGKIVRLTGHLVNYQDDNGWRWKSSTSRTDAGPGACELLYVEKVEVF